ncbi:MAG: hypothetical protein IJT97_02545 [Bacteroidaceae bacterium]|nr:hypothetical protein [Bacteroidaceae bacterium]
MGGLELHYDTSLHYIIVEGGMMPLFKQDWLDKYVYFIDIEPEVCGNG